MNEKGRLYNSMLNLISGFGYRILILITAFVVRTVFVRCLTSEYLSVNGLYSNILTMLSLTELGFGSAMVFSMYQPLAYHNTERLQQLLYLYKKVYTIIGTVIFCSGVCLIPFLDYLIKDKPDISGLTFYYILYLLNSSLSYWFFAYRNSILQADQKSHILTNYQSIFNLVKSIVQIFVLLIFHNFTLYLLSQMLCTLAQNIAIAKKVQSEYPDILRKPQFSLPKEETKKIFADVKALMLSKVSHVILNGTDNIIISAFVSFTKVGLLSNFLMISEAITGILTQITGALSASLGNYFAKEDREASYIIFKRIEFLNFWLYGFCMISLIILLRPFIILWLGSKFLLSQTVVVALSINFFVAGFMNTLWTFRSTLGLFTQGKYRPLIVAIINIGLSILLSFPLGVAGVLFATSLSRACVNLWYDPWLLHRHGFKKSVIPFFVNYVFRILLIIFITLTLNIISNLVFEGGVSYIRFVVMLFIVVVLSNFIFLISFFHTEEFRYFYSLIKKMYVKFLK